MRRLSALPLLAVAAACFLSPGQAAAASLPAGSTAILSGAPSLFEPLSTGVGYAETDSEAVSVDGVLVAFSSTSDALAPDDNDGAENVYVKNTLTGAVTFVSRANGSGGAAVDGRCTDPAISADGTTVAFVCDGSLDPADRNMGPDVYARRITTNETFLVSRVGGAGAVAAGSSLRPSVSGDGSFVAFDSDAKNLDMAAGMQPGRHVFRRHIGGNNEIVLLSVKVAGEGGGPVQGIEPSISDDGTKIAWTNNAGVPPQNIDTNGKADVYLRSVPAGTTDMVSRQSSGGGLSDGHSGTPVISGDGSTVAFESEAKNLDGADPDTSSDIYVRELNGLQTRLVSIAGTTKGTESTQPSISSNGVVVGFLSEGKLDPADTSTVRSAYVKHDGTKAVHLVSRGDGDAGPSSAAQANDVAVSGDGKKIAATIESGAGVPGADPRRDVVALRDIAAIPQRTSLVSRPPGSDPFVDTGDATSQAALSADGRFAVMSTYAVGLGVPPDLSRAVVVRDRVTGELTVASRADGPTGAYLKATDFPPAISADGRRVAFQADGAQFNEIWVRDIVANRSWLASRADTAGGAPANAPSVGVRLDGDGSRVVFRSTATNLHPADTDPVQDVFVRDVDAERTYLASRATGENGAKGNGDSSGTDISADGERVLFLSQGKNLAPADTDTQNDVYLRDLAAQTTTLAGVAPDGTQPDGSVDTATFDAAGNRIAFETDAPNLLGVTNTHPKIFIRDLGANTLELASRAGLAGAPLDGPTGDPEISPDGRYVAFRGLASTLPGATPNQLQVYLRDLATGNVELISRENGPNGGRVTGRLDGSPSVTTGGGCVAFRARQDLFGGHTDYAQAYIRAVRADCAASDPVPGPDGGGGGGPGGPGGPGGGAGPGGQGPDGGRDSTAPSLTRARLKPSRLRIGKRSVLSFRSTEAASLTLTYERRRGTRRFKRAGSTTHKVKAGSGRITIAGRVGRKRLAPGNYRITLVARDAAGNKSKPVRLSFTIIKKKG